MVQKEVKKKTSIYGTVAILSAIHFDFYGLRVWFNLA